MEHFVNNEIFKNNLEKDLDETMDKKNYLYDQLKKLEV